MSWIEQAKEEVGGIVDVPAGESGTWKILKWTQTEEMALRSMFAYKDRLIPVGEYTALLDGKQPYMTDTPAEVGDHETLIDHVNGDVLVFGLGIGMVMEMIMDNYRSGFIPYIRKVVFIEKNQDVIDLVAPHYQAKYPDHFMVVKADAFELTPQQLYLQTGIEGYSAIWIDIWPDICSDNADEYSQLLSRWETEGDWVHCWQEDWVFANHSMDDLFGGGI